MLNIRSSRRAVTLLELMTVMVIIALLFVLLMPVLESVRKRTEKINCTGNLRGLYLGANSYVQQYGHWPQIDTSLTQTNRKQYDRQWTDTLAPFDVPHQAWICPTMQRLSKTKDYDSTEDYRNDYQPMPFDAKPMTPYRWPNMPWFLEKGDVHGNGQLIIFTDGSIRDVKDVALKTK